MYNRPILNGKVSDNMAALFSELSTDLRSGKWIPAISATLLSGVLMSIIGISLAAYIFAGDLAGALPQGIGMILFTMLVLGLFIGLFGAIRGSVAGAQDAPTAITAVMAGHIANAMGADASGVVVTVFAAIAVSAVVTGIFMGLLGRFKMGNLVRYIPYPVVGGFLAGTGLLLIQGGMSVMTQLPFAYDDLVPFLEPDALEKWLPGIVFATAMAVIVRRFRHFLVLPSLLAGGLIIFFGVALAVGSSIDDLEAAGWLLGPFPEESRWEPVLLTQFDAIDWRVVIEEGSKHFPIIALIATVSLLLNVSGIEIAANTDVDVNKELQIAGTANLLSGAAGGYVGYHVLSLTVLNDRVGAATRLTALLWGGFFASILIGGTQYIAFFPRVILGALVAFIGLGMLLEWVYDGLRQLPRQDYAIIWLIMIVIGGVGFLEGVLFGLFISIVLFVVEYSRTDIVRHALRGDVYHSTVHRSESSMNLLKQHGRQVGIYHLHGFVFFGTAANLGQQIAASDAPHDPLRYVILNFRGVRGLDSTAVLSFNKLRQNLAVKDIITIFVALGPTMQRQFSQGGYALDDSERFRHFADEQAALAWCEEQVLAEVRQDETLLRNPLQAVQEIFGGQVNMDDLLPVMTLKAVTAGEVLAQQGDKAGAMFMVKSGRLQVMIENENGGQLVIRRIESGGIVGELSVYASKTRTASIIVEESGEVYMLSQEMLAHLSEKHPQMAAKLHYYIAQLLAKRLDDTTATLRALL